jgi:deazaflavin-dependent oxidoreductase (nitroreductase family)
LIRQLFKNRTRSMRYSESAPQTSYIKWVPREPLMKLLGKFHTQFYRYSGGLIGGRIDGLDILVLTTIGSKTGEKRSVPLPYFRDGKNYVLIASFGGNDKNPAWLNNLSKTPEVELRVGFASLKARASVAKQDERTRIWGNITAAFPRYLQYQQKTERQIPVVVLEVTGGTWWW